MITSSQRIRIRICICVHLRPQMWILHRTRNLGRQPSIHIYRQMETLHQLMYPIIKSFFGGVALCIFLLTLTETIRQKCLFSQYFVVVMFRTDLHYLVIDHSKKPSVLIESLNIQEYCSSTKSISTYRIVFFSSIVAFLIVNV